MRFNGAQIPVDLPARTTDNCSAQMKNLFRWLIRLFVTLVILLIVLVVVAVLLKDVIAKSIAERNLRDTTGLDARISKLEVGLSTPTVNLEGLKLYNTADFGGSTFLDLPELRMEYVPDDVRTGKLRFKTVRLHLSEVHVVRNKNGRTNIEMLQKETRKKSTGGKEKTDKPGVDFGGIETLYLTIGKIHITDERDPRNNDVIDIGLKDEVGKNLKTEAEITQWFQMVMLRRAFATAVSEPQASRRERLQKLLRVFGVNL
jgi:uncharacterized protein involved in outer membrane biogenesis